jgi:hypothetical protein
MVQKFDANAELGAIGSMGGEQKFEVPPHQVDSGVNSNPRDVVKDMLAEERERKRRTMLAWKNRSDYRTPHGRPVARDRTDGAYDHRLPGIGPIFGYWIQNDRIFYGKGREVTLEQVPEKMIWKGKVERREPAVSEEVFPRADVKKALEAARATRMRNDPNVCRICGSYTASGRMDYTAHFAKVHPAELQRYLEGLEQIAAEPEPEPEPEPSPARRKRPVIQPSA